MVALTARLGVAVSAKAEALAPITNAVIDARNRHVLVSFILFLSFFAIGPWVSY
jgi:hypothetical protein